MIKDGVGDGGYPISGDPFLTKTLLLSLYSILCWYQPSGFCESPIFEGVVLPHFSFRWAFCLFFFSLLRALFCLIFFFLMGFLPLFLFFSEGVVLPHFFSPGLFCLVFSFLFFLVCFCFPEFVFCLIFSGSIHSLMLTEELILDEGVELVRI